MVTLAGFSLTEDKFMGQRWLSGRASDSEARGPEFEPHDRRIMFLSKTL